MSSMTLMTMRAGCAGMRRARGLAMARLLWSLLVMAAIAGAMMAVVAGRGIGEGAGAPATDFFTVQRMDFDLTITASGDLEAAEQVEIKSRVNGRPAILEIVEEGSRVTAGDVLVRLDTDDLVKNLEQARLQEEEARAALVGAQQTLEIETREAESKQKAAEVSLSLAELDLARWSKGDVVKRREELKLAIERARRRVERAERDYVLSQDLYERQFISLNELEDAELEKVNAADALTTAKLDAEVYEAYEYVRDKQDHESKVDQARAALQRTIAQNRNTLARLTSDLASKQKQAAIRTQQRVDLEDQLAKAVIRAPQDGLVVYASSVGSHWRRGDPIGPGRQVRFGETMVLLPDTRRMVASLLVHEAQIGQVQVDQPAAVTIDARPGRPVAGKVVSKAVTPEDGGFWNPNLRQYKVLVGLPEGIEGLKPAMRCTGQIQVGRVTDALAVPIQAVFTEAEQRFCYLPVGPRVRRQPVTIGRASETMVQVLSGLEVGDRVLLRDPKPGEALDDGAEPDA